MKIKLPWLPGLLLIATMLTVSSASGQEELRQRTGDAIADTAPPAAPQEAAEEDQAEVPKEYTFDVKINLEHTEIKSQDQTGTCWCFAGASFIESELIRMGKGKHDLSEMFVVSNIYQDKAQNYLLRKGKAQFGEGALGS